MLPWPGKLTGLVKRVNKYCFCKPVRVGKHNGLVSKAGDLLFAIFFLSLVSLVSQCNLLAWLRCVTYKRNMAAFIVYAKRFLQIYFLSI